MTTAVVDSAWIQTWSGRAFHFMDPRADEINVGDIAHALSLQCRFSGHCNKFYSVAEHSVRVSIAIHTNGVGIADHNPETVRLESLWGLLHDASEAYLTDVARPVKRFLANYAEIEEGVMRVVAERFGLEWPMPQIVKHFDNALLATEARDLMVKPPMPWGWMPEPLTARIEPMGPGEACNAFMQRFESLYRS